MSDNSQQQESGGEPGAQAPQSNPATPVSPNPLGSLHNPLAQGQQPPRDWEASFKGLNTRYQEDRQKWEQERTQFGEALTQLTDRLAKLESAQPQEKPPTKSQDDSPAPNEGQAPAAPNPSDVLYERLTQLEAERYRDNMLIEMSEPGQPGAGLNLFMFRENIPAIKPDVADSGKVDDSGQREAILSFIKKVKGTQASTGQPMAGYTPGSAPGPQRPPTRQEKMARYEQVAKQYGDADPGQMSETEYGALREEYYDLINELGSEIPGVTKPWMSSTELANSVSTLLRKMGIVENKLNLQE